MRIYFTKTDTPKKAAKRVFHHYRNDWPEAPFKLSHAQELTARMLGYESWHNLVRVTADGKHHQSLMDEECSTDEQLKRLQFQAECLKDFTPNPIDRMELAILFRVSARNPNSLLLADNRQNYNSFEYQAGEGNQIGEWFFRRSLRTLHSKNVEDSPSFMHVPGVGITKQFLSYFDKKLLEHPEDIVVIHEYLRLSLELGNFDRVSIRLDSFASQLRICMPQDFKGAKVLYAHRRNRHFLRAAFWLGVCFYEDGRYKDAKRWLTLTSTICDELAPACKSFLVDLASANPTGQVSILDEVGSARSYI